MKTLHPKKSEMQILLKFNDKSYKTLILQPKKGTEAKNWDEHIYLGIGREAKNSIEVLKMFSSTQISLPSIDTHFSVFKD